MSLSKDSAGSGKLVVDFINNRLQLLKLLAVESDPLLPRLSFHGVLVDVVLSDIDVSPAIVLLHLHPLVHPQVPAGLLIPLGALGDGHGVLLGSLGCRATVIWAGVALIVYQRSLVLLLSLVRHGGLSSFVSVIRSESMNIGLFRFLNLYYQLGHNSILFVFGFSVSKPTQAFTAISNSVGE